MYDVKTYIAALTLFVLLAGCTQKEQQFVGPIQQVFVGPVYVESTPRVPVLAQTELECLALNIYFEARSLDEKSQMAVSMVVLNRSKDPFWPNNLCDVVKQGSYKDGYVKRHRCQFSWYCDGLSDNPREQQTWTQSLRVAKNSYNNWINGHDITEGSTNYHADYVKPVWRKDSNMNYVTTIGSHLFYRWNTEKNVAIN